MLEKYNKYKNVCPLRHHKALKSIKSEVFMPQFSTELLNMSHFIMFLILP